MYSGHCLPLLPHQGKLPRAAKSPVRFGSSRSPAVRINAPPFFPESVAPACLFCLIPTHCPPAVSWYLQRQGNSRTLEGPWVRVSGTGPAHPCAPLPPSITGVLQPLSCHPLLSWGLLYSYSFIPWGVIPFLSPFFLKSLLWALPSSL